MFNVELLAKNQELNEVKVTLKALKEETTKIIQEAQDAQAKSEEEANAAKTEFTSKTEKLDAELRAKNEELKGVKQKLKVASEQTSKKVQEAQEAQAKSEEEANTANIQLLDKERELNLLKKERLTSKRKSFIPRSVSNMERKAFLIGNTYENSTLKTLKGAAKSAKKVHEALSDLGFQCSLNINKTLDEMRNELL